MAEEQYRRDIEETDEVLDSAEGDPVNFWEEKQRELVTSVVDYNLSTLTDLIVTQAIDLSPQYQRRYRWDEIRQSKLIESFLMNVPVPPIFLNEDRYGKYSVIDGKQRLFAISNFLRGRLKLKGLKVFSDINGLFFDDLPGELRVVIKTRPTLRSIIILRQSDEDVKFEVFQRLNSGGVLVNPQEIRNSAYTGPLNNMILAQSAVRIVIETVMREELDQFIGAAWGECSPKRKGYRNGHYTRDLVTSTGRLEEIKVPRDRAGQFHTQAFARYSRYEPHIAEGLTQMFVAGTSTHKVGEVAQTLMGVAPSASTISRLNQTLTQQFEAWRQRPLQQHWRILYLDGVHFSIRHGEKTDSTIILTALGVDLAGNKEVLALRACAEESKDGWACLLQDLRARGATQIDLIVTDGHDGLLAAVSDLFAATPRQRCLLHKQRNVLNAIPRRERGDVQAELVGIWEQPTKQEALTQLAAFKAKYSKRYPEAVRSLAEDEEHLLTFYAFPQSMHRSIQTTNAIESLFSNVRQRTDQIDVFTTETSCLAIVWATIQDIRLHKISV